MTHAEFLMQIRLAQSILIKTLAVRLEDKPTVEIVAMTAYVAAAEHLLRHIVDMGIPESLTVFGVDN